MSETSPADDLETREHPWTEHVDTLLRWRRFVVSGIALTWGPVLIVAALWPRAYVAEATVALPNLAFAGHVRPTTANERERKPGIAVGTYKKVEAALADESLLGEALRGTLDQRGTERIRRDLKQVVSPVTTGARDDLARADREDTVVAVRLSYVDHSESRVSAVVNALVGLVRDSLSMRVARDEVEVELLQARSAASAALTKKLSLSASNQSLRTLAEDLRNLLTTSPNTTSSAREVVDLANGGHRYLPVAVQLVAAKALQADNDHEIRQAGWSFRVESLKVAFYQRLESKLRGTGAPPDASVAADAPALIDGELRAFLEKQSGDAPDYLRAEVEAMSDLLRAHRAATAFIQRPSIRTLPRTPLVLGSLLTSAAAILIAALVGESWRRYHRSTAKLTA
jgi:hypothetical protein